MKARQYKKLCKKSAEIMNFRSCFNDDGDGIYYVMIYCGGYASEWDSSDCWYFLIDCFDNDVNMVTGEHRMCRSDNPVKPTPANVFAWARTQNW